MEQNKILNMCFSALDDLFQPQEVKDYFLEYIKKPFGFLLLSGKNGTGKSFSAEKILNSISYPHNIDVNPEYASPYKKIITQSELNHVWQKTMADYGNTIYLLNQIIFIKILVLDDVGTRTPTDAF